jgi:diaminopimelate decarboxylase
VVSGATPRALWPDALAVGASGRLELDGCDLEALARGHGTPLWAISRSTVEGNFDRLLAAFQGRYRNCEIAYSMKAHNTLAVVRLLHRRGAKIDASAEYEFQLALAAGVPPEEIILNGNGKSDLALETAARLEIRQVNVDSLDEVLRLEAAAAAIGTRVRCVVRLQLTYAELLAEDPSFESTLRIGEGKFGSNVATGQARATIEAVLASPHLELVGLHHHVGFSGYMGDYTPEREVMHHRACTRELCAFANRLRAELGVQVARLDLGGGFRMGGDVLLSTPGAAADIGAHPLPAAADYASAIFDTLESELEVDEPPLVQFETGGYQIADAVLMLVAVSEIKHVPHDPPLRYVVADGSMMMFVARGMMRVGHPVVAVVDPLREPLAVLTDVVGQTCVYDSVAEGIRLPELAQGDLLAFLQQGAYCETESTQFNGFPRPEVVLLHEGRSTTVKRRETIADVHARDIVPPELWTTA